MLVLVFYIILSVFIAWIWVDYFRLIDIYNRNHLKYFAATFAIGSLSILITFGIRAIGISFSEDNFSDNFFADLIYVSVNVGMVEEFSKLVPFLISYYLFRKEFREPIDYIAFFSTTALGFAAVENVMYFREIGPEAITARAITSTVSHMIDSSFIAYGIVLYKFRYHHLNKWLILAASFIAASFSHGFYDYWLMIQQPGSWVVTLLYFLFTISIYASILNNALNNSPYFSYKHVVNSQKTGTRIFLYYLAVYLIQIILLSYLYNVRYALGNIFSSLFTIVIIFIITERLSRFKLIEKRWETLKFELPFHIYFIGDERGIYYHGHHHQAPFGLYIRVKGEGFNETYINQYFNEYFYLQPLSRRRKSYLGTRRLAYIDQKIFLKNDLSYYLIKLYRSTPDKDFKVLLIKPKTFGKTLYNEQHPIVALFSIEHLESIYDPSLSIKDLKFIEWAVITPYSRK